MTFVFNILCGFRPYQPGTCVVFLSGVFLDLCSTWTYEFRLWCNCTLLVGCSVLPARHVTPNSCARNPGRYTFLNIEQRRKHFKGASWGGRLFLQHEAVCPEAVADKMHVESRRDAVFSRVCVLRGCRFYSWPVTAIESSRSDERCLDFLPTSLVVTGGWQAVQPPRVPRLPIRKRGHLFSLSRAPVVAKRAESEKPAVFDRFIGWLCVWWYKFDTSPVVPLVWLMWEMGSAKLGTNDKY